MKRRFPLYAIIAFLVSGFAVCSCNDDDDDDEIQDIDPAVNAVMVKSFSLKPNDSILANLDSVYFSIDLDNATIFNADSLPKGTKVNRLQISMSTTTVSKAEITMPNDRGIDTVVNYLTNSSDSINFSRGFVKLHLESFSGEVSRDYTIYVNVHKVDPDLMVWQETASAQLPSSLSAPEEQRTVEYDGKILCFTLKGTDCCVAETDDPAASWTKSSVTLPSGADLNTLTAATDALYIIAGDVLYKSGDKGASWSSTGVSMHHIYGSVDEKVVGVKLDGAAWKHVTYPSSSEADVDPLCPVEGTSPAVVYTSEWSESPMLIVAGGLTASGALSGGCWAYDGTQWAMISVEGLPGLEAPVLVPYFAYKTSAYWRVTKQSVLLAFGGTLQNGQSNRKVYVSYDYGVHWAEASEQMQLPAQYIPGAYAQTVVYNKTFTSGASTAWRERGSSVIPVGYSVMPYSSSRAVAPITEWDCPYIYVFGGESSSGVLYDQVWRGVINRLEFKPLQ